MTSSVPMARLLGKKLSLHLRPVDPSERQQALIRFAIIAGLTPYFLWYRFFNHGEITLQIFMILLLFVLYSTAALASVYLDIGGATLRRSLCFLIDTVFICYTMHVGDRVCAPMVLCLYWQNTGYPYRYGEKYLLYGTTVSGVSFLLVLLTTPYWQQNWEMGYAMLLGSTAMPAFFVGNMVKKIKDAKSKAEVANKTKSRFLSNMSHEMRTPLNGILGTTDLLSGTAVDPEQQEFLKIVKTSATHLLSLVNDVLDISKIEEGRVDIVPEEMDLHALVQNSAMIVSRDISSKGLALRIIMSPGVPFLLRGDATRIRQILANLLSNAVKFTHAGDITVRVLREAEDDRTATVRFEVSDTGIGMTQEQQSRIFDRFTQADDSITRRYGGTGLGTSISKELVELMGGRIGVQSRKDRGSTFWFSIPLEKQPAASLTAVMRRRLSGTRVLLVSSDDKAAETISGYLASVMVTRIKRAYNTGQAYDYANRISKDPPFDHMAIVVRNGLGEDPIRFSATLESMDIHRCMRLVLVGDAGGEEALRHGYRSVLASADITRDFMCAVHYALPYEDRQEDIAPSPGTAADRRLTILVAEDNEINQTVIRKVLERAGHKVRTVPDGRQALDVLAAERFDVALLDLNMPILSGIDTAKEYISKAEGNPIPLVALTADATVESKKACEEVGMKAYITKPFESKKVLAVLRSVVPATAGEPVQTPQIPQIPSVPFPKPENPLFDEMIDEEKLRELEEIGPTNDFIKNIVWVFVRDSEKHIRSMEDALEKKDITAYSTSAHSLKGIAGAMGAMRVMDLASEMEQQGVMIPMSARYALLALIRTEILRVRKSLMKRYSVSDPVAG